MSCSRARSLAACCMVVVGGLSSARLAVAAGPRKPLTGYTVTSWSKKDGLTPGMVYALAQDHEGYLWLGTDNGLYRFDGLRFISWDSLSATPLPKASVRILYVSTNGDLWAALEGGIVARSQNGRLRTFTKDDGLDVGSVTTILESAAGTIWVGGRNGLFSTRGEGWTKADVPAAPISAGFVDRSHFMVSSVDTLFQWEPAQKHFVTAKIQGTPQAIAADATGQTYITDLTSGFKIVGRAQDSSNRGRGMRLLADHLGNLWIGTLGQGLWHVRAADRTRPDAVERTLSLTGLLNDDGVLSLAEDRDGTIWVGLTEGLVRLIRHSIDQITDVGLVTNLMAHPRGDVWLGTTDELIRLPGGKEGRWREHIPLGGLRLRAMATDSHGRLRVATDRAVSEVTGGKLVNLPGLGERQQIEWISSDGGDGFWVADRRAGLGRWVNGKMSESRLPAEAAKVRSTAFLTDREGRLWVALADGRVAVVEKDRPVRMLKEPESITGGYSAIYEDSRGAVWLGGTSGLSRYNNGTFVAVRVADGFPGEVSCIVEDMAGSLWVGTTLGIIHFQREAFDAAADRKTARKFHYVQYDRGDGIAGMPLVRYSNNQRAARSADGRVWFIGARGVSLIDPRSMTPPPPPKLARIDGIFVNSMMMRATPDVVLPPKTSKLAIDYTTLNLRSMSKTRFRYRLDGFDTDWIEAGTRQEASYTNLPPRGYKFRVSAIEDQSAGSPTETVLSFSIQPMFYQTRWFAGLAVSLLVGLVWTAWALHVRRIRHAFALVTGERTRLSREIHDTLLQGLVGLALQCDDLANDAAASPERRNQCLRLRKRIDTYVREARSSIGDLRSTTQGTRDLGTALKAAAEQIAAGTSLNVVCEVKGGPVRHAPVVDHQLLRIAREAITNVVRHARASELRIALHYRPDGVELTVTDDGCGFDPEANGRDGIEHYGLRGIRERAENMNGAIKVRSRAREGTSLEVTVPLDPEPSSRRLAWPRWAAAREMVARQEKA